MPIAMPSAPYASAATRPRPSKNPPAAMTGIAALHRVDDLRQQQGGGHRAGVTATLPALHEHRVDAPLEHLLGVALRADRRHDEHAAVVQLPDQVSLRRLGEARDLHASRRSAA